ncbi:MAG TPA: S-layer homology domain-containing protein, partial [Clostridia bacterium]|nr:S-layer homology domain-containing protein [Clostridia bacterium]
MRGKNLIIAVTLAFFLCGVALPAGAAPFKDVAGHWAEKNIARMYAKGVVAGYGEEYKPNDPITKEQAVVMLIRVLGLESDTHGQTIPVTFRNPDAVSAYARPSVALAVNRGIVAGGDLLDFRPQGQAKRYEIAVLVARALGFDGTGTGGTLPFTDSRELSDQAAWAVSFVQYVYQQGVMGGDASGAFRPMASVTRAEMAAVLARIDEKVNKLASMSIKGEVFSVSPPVRSLLLQDAGANIVTIPVADKAMIYRENKEVSLDKISKGDKLLVIKNAQGQAIYVEVIPADQFSYDETIVKGTVETVQQGTPLLVFVRTASGLVSHSVGA